MITIEKLYEYFLESRGVETDTRKATAGKLFFCLRGERFNANELAGEALEKGAYRVVVDEARYARHPHIIVTDNVLNTLQMLARHHRRRFDIPVIAVTGTNGKTTTKELMAAVLSAHYKAHYTRGNFNNHIGVPLTLLAMPADTQMAVIEMGANHPGEIEALCRIAEPGYGLITNVGKAHIEGFGSFQGVVRTKTELYRFLKEQGGTAFVHQNDDLLMQQSASLNRVLYGAPRTAVMTAPAPFVMLKYKDKELKTKLLGKYNFTNLMAAIATGEAFEVPEAAIRKALSSYDPGNQRSQYLVTARNKIYLDAYNANPSSMKEALESFGEIALEPKMPVLGDMLELGHVSSEEHHKLVERVKEAGYQRAMFVGPCFYRWKNDDGLFFRSTEEALQYLRKHPVKDYFILLKGSRGIGLEKLLEAL